VAALLIVIVKISRYTCQGVGQVGKIQLWAGYEFFGFEMCPEALGLGTIIAFHLEVLQPLRSRIPNSFLYT
jgi:hypothetical protein